MGKKPEEQNCLDRSWIAAVSLIAVLAAVSFIPPRSIGGVHLRRANILSDILAFDDRTTEAEEPELFDEEEFLIDMEQVAERVAAVQIAADTQPRPVRITFEWDVRRDSLPPARGAVPDSGRRSPALVPVEDYDTTGHSPMTRFYEALLTGGRPVRIAVLGDSFIEGDIMTADLREALQSLWDGEACGAGFAPMASPLTGFRRSIGTRSEGWTSYNIMQRKRAPETVRDKFYLSGWACTPEPGAATRWEGVDAYKYLDRSRCARIFFLSPRDSRIEITLNDGESRRFDVEGAPAVRQVVVRADSIRSLAFRVLSATEGFIGYGATFESDGAVVDNYSVRSNNGQAMFWTDPSIDAQIGALAGGYDLVILQYGLNIMQPGVRSYANYSRQIEKMTAFVRQCFPGAAVLILGVSDRSVKTDRGFEPMDAIPYMLDCQRQTARRTGAAFWPTCDAMRAQGGMERFVENGWAGKDFTHINFAGGRRVALALFDALNAELQALRRTEAEARISERPETVLDSAKTAAVTRELLKETAPEPLNLPRR